MDKITMVKPGVLNLVIGTGIVRKLQEVLNFIIKDLTKENIEEYSELFKKGTSSENYPKEWMTHAYNLSFLIKVCEDTALSQNLTYDKDLDSSYSNIDELFNEEGN